MNAIVVGGVILLSELGLLFYYRNGGFRYDRLSLAVIYLFTLPAVAMAFFLAYSRPESDFYGSNGLVVSVIASIFFTTGLFLRQFSVIVLGRFFTLNLAVHPGHRLIQVWPYSILRHPSYTGMILCITSVGMVMEYWPSLLLMVLSYLVAIMYRIEKEEAMMRQVFPTEYPEYCQRTYRLIPYVY